ncbi:Mu transposase C-terminal domain-containing protein [Paraburkholderia sediminicola]|uniref:Mu transposase C-terminal domain-containing protein n=1 Tax=Paraburkholderia sediminicola TaxID=458836 RepID=UPI0038BAB578
MTTPHRTLRAPFRLLRFLPIAPRTIQPDGLNLFWIRYWHPLFTVWRETRRAVAVRYHPEDLSRVFVSAGKKCYIEVRYADLRRPPISLFEQRAALKSIRARGQRTILEREIFETVMQQRSVIVNATRATRRRRRSRPQSIPSVGKLDRQGTQQQLEQRAAEQVDYDSPVTAYDVEQW